MRSRAGAWERGQTQPQAKREWQMKKFTVLLALIALVVSAAGVYAQPQPPDTLWTKTFGGSSGDLGMSVQQTSEGGYIVAGYTESYGVGQSDVYLIKTDANGNETWSQTYGGSAYDYSESVQQTSDGGYIIAGSTSSYGAGSYDVYLIKTDANGNELWSQTFGGSSIDCGLSIQQTSDGGYIIAGYTGSYGAGNSDVYLIKTDASGNEQWTQTFGGSSSDFGWSVQQTSDGGYIIAGWTSSYGAGSWDVYLIKTDANGNESWSQTFGGINYDEGCSVQQTSDGGYIIAGSTESYGAGLCDVYLIKTDANGNETWSQTFGGSNSDGGSSVQQTTDGGYIITGWTQSYGAGSWDVYLMKTDANGNEQWSQTFGGSNSDGGSSVQQTSDGGFIIAGHTTSYGVGGDDVYLIRLDSEGSIVEEFSENQPSVFALHPPHPNPFNSSTAISWQLQAASFVKLAVYDIQGREVAVLLNQQQAAGSWQLTWDAEGMESGVYFVWLAVDGGQSMVRKVVLIK